jgi:hypothetical protein
VSTGIGSKGEKVRGWIAFEVPKAASLASIKYVVDLVSGESLQVGLKK